MKIRKYQNKDYKQVKKLVTTIIWELYNQKPNNIQDLENISKNYIAFYVAEENNKIIGIVSLQKYKNKIAKLRRLYINKNYREKGLGKKLLKLIEKIARKNIFQRIILNTNYDNEKSITLYEKNGFSKYKRIKSRIYLRKNLK